MKTNNLSDLFTVSITKIRHHELINFFKLCLKYGSKLFDDGFFSENFSTPERFLKFIKNSKDFIYTIKVGKNADFAGFVYLYDTRKNPCGTFDTSTAFCLKRKYWGHGSYLIGKKVLKFLFEKLWVRKLSVEIVGEKSLALSLIQRVGFNYEATLKAQCFKEGREENLHIFSMFNPALYKSANDT